MCVLFTNNLYLCLFAHCSFKPIYKIYVFFVNMNYICNNFSLSLSLSLSAAAVAIIMCQIVKMLYPILDQNPSIHHIMICDCKPTPTPYTLTLLYYYS